MPDVGFALVGLGYGATRCQMLAETPGARLAAVVDARPERAKSIGEQYGVPWYTDHREMLARSDVDVVGVYTPTGLHRDVAVDVVSSAKHVLLTKPMETTVARADAIIQAARSARVEVFSEFYLRYYRDNWRLKRAAEDGTLGRLVLGEFSFKCFRPDDYYRSDGAWRQTWELNGGGVTMNQGIHAIDLLTWIMGPVVELDAVTGTFAHEIPVEDTAVAIMRLASGALATLTTTTTYRTTSGMDDIYGGGFTTRSEVNGTRGSLSLQDERLVMQKLEDGGLADYPGKPLNVFDDIARSLTDPSRTSPALARAEDGRAVVELAQAVYRAADTGERASLPAGATPEGR
jgi:predicted dehydrogenase